MAERQFCHECRTFHPLHRPGGRLMECEEALRTTEAEVERLRDTLRQITEHEVEGFAAGVARAVLKGDAA
jgi:hypothetical protein